MTRAGWWTVRWHVCMFALKPFGFCHTLSLKKLPFSGRFLQHLSGKQNWCTGLWQWQHHFSPALDVGPIKVSTIAQGMKTAPKNHNNPKRKPRERKAVPFIIQWSAQLISFIFFLITFTQRNTGAKTDAKALAETIPCLVDAGNFKWKSKY